jgi:hypothetical protein
MPYCVRFQGDCGDPKTTSEPILPVKRDSDLPLSLAFALKKYNSFHCWEY